MTIIANGALNNLIPFFQRFSLLKGDPGQDPKLNAKGKGDLENIDTEKKSTEDFCLAIKKFTEPSFFQQIELLRIKNKLPNQHQKYTEIIKKVKQLETFLKAETCTENKKTIKALHKDNPEKINDLLEEIETLMDDPPCSMQHPVLAYEINNFLDVLRTMLSAVALVIMFGILAIPVSVSNCITAIALGLSLLSHGGIEIPFLSPKFEEQAWKHLTTRLEGLYRLLDRHVKAEASRSEEAKSPKKLSRSLSLSSRLPKKTIDPRKVEDSVIKFA